MGIYTNYLSPVASDIQKEIIYVIKAEAASGRSEAESLYTSNHTATGRLIFLSLFKRKRARKIHPPLASYELYKNALLRT
jgi:hypothetical protein